MGLRDRDGVRGKEEVHMDLKLALRSLKEKIVAEDELFHRVGIGFADSFEVDGIFEKQTVEVEREDKPPGPLLRAVHGRTDRIDVCAQLKRFREKCFISGH